MVSEPEITRLAHVLNHDSKERTQDINTGESTSFSDLLLSTLVLDGLHSAGFVKPSPIQLQAIPIGRCGLDMVVQAKSGTGKTCVFVVVTLESVVVSSPACQAVIVAPTREIADQIHTAISRIGVRLTGLKTALVIGGSAYSVDVEKLKGAQIVVGTPGRLSQLALRGDLLLETVRMLVLDEADKLMEACFQENINWMFSKLPRSKQVLVFSATYPRELDQLLCDYMRSPAIVRMSADDVQLIGIKQYVKRIELQPSTDPLVAKVDFLHRFLSNTAFGQCLVFCNLQSRAQDICSHLAAREWPAMFISAGRSQVDRSSVMALLKSFQCRILVSTDLTARGIDAENVNLVINFDIPLEPETYFHRIGRAGRYGGYGAALTLCYGQIERAAFDRMAAMEKFIVKPLPDSYPSDLVENESYWMESASLDLPNYLSVFARRAALAPHSAPFSETKNGLQNKNDVMPASGNVPGDADKDSEIDGSTSSSIILPDSDPMLSATLLDYLKSCEVTVVGDDANDGRTTLDRVREDLTNGWRADLCNGVSSTTPNADCNDKFADNNCDNLSNLASSDNPGLIFESASSSRLVYDRRTMFWLWKRSINLKPSLDYELWTPKCLRFKPNIYFHGLKRCSQKKLVESRSSNNLNYENAPGEEAATLKIDDLVRQPNGDIASYGVKLTNTEPLERPLLTQKNVIAGDSTPADGKITVKSVSELNKKDSYPNFDENSDSEVEYDNDYDSFRMTTKKFGSGSENGIMKRPFRFVAVEPDSLKAASDKLGSISSCDSSGQTHTPVPSKPVMTPIHIFSTSSNNVGKPNLNRLIGFKDGGRVEKKSIISKVSCSIPDSAGIITSVSLTNSAEQGRTLHTVDVKSSKFYSPQSSPIKSSTVTGVSVKIKSPNPEKCVESPTILESSTKANRTGLIESGSNSSQLLPLSSILRGICSSSESSYNSSEDASDEKGDGVSLDDDRVEIVKNQNFENDRIKVLRYSRKEMTDLKGESLDNSTTVKDLLLLPNWLHAELVSKKMRHASRPAGQNGISDNGFATIRSISETSCDTSDAIATTTTMPNSLKLTDEPIDLLRFGKSLSAGSGSDGLIQYSRRELIALDLHYLGTIPDMSHLSPSTRFSLLRRDQNRSRPYRSPYLKATDNYSHHQQHASNEKVTSGFQYSSFSTGSDALDSGFAGAASSTPKSVLTYIPLANTDKPVDPVSNPIVSEMLAGVTSTVSFHTGDDSSMYHLRLKPKKTVVASSDDLEITTEADKGLQASQFSSDFDETSKSVNQKLLPSKVSPVDGSKDLDEMKNVIPGSSHSIPQSTVPLSGGSKKSSTSSVSPLFDSSNPLFFAASGSCGASFSPFYRSAVGMRASNHQMGIYQSLYNRHASPKSTPPNMDSSSDICKETFSNADEIDFEPAKASVTAENRLFICSEHNQSAAYVRLQQNLQSASDKVAAAEGIVRKYCSDRLSAPPICSLEKPGKVVEGNKCATIETDGFGNSVEGGAKLDRHPMGDPHPANRGRMMRYTKEEMLSILKNPGQPLPEKSEGIFRFKASSDGPDSRVVANSRIVSPNLCFNYDKDMSSGAFQLSLKGVNTSVLGTSLLPPTILEHSVDGGTKDYGDVETTDEGTESKWGSFPANLAKKLKLSPISAQSGKGVPDIKINPSPSPIVNVAGIVVNDKLQNASVSSCEPSNGMNHFGKVIPAEAGKRRKFASRLAAEELSCLKDVSNIGFETISCTLGSVRGTFFSSTPKIGGNVSNNPSSAATVTKADKEMSKVVDKPQSAAGKKTKKIASRFANAEIDSLASIYDPVIDKSGEESSGDLKFSNENIDILHFSPKLEGDTVVACVQETVDVQKKHDQLENKTMESSHGRSLVNYDTLFYKSPVETGETFSTVMGNKHDSSVREENSVRQPLPERKPFQEHEIEPLSVESSKLGLEPSIDDNVQNWCKHHSDGDLTVDIVPNRRNTTLSGKVGVSGRSDVSEKIPTKFSEPGLKYIPPKLAAKRVASFAELDDNKKVENGKNQKVFVGNKLVELVTAETIANGLPSVTRSTPSFSYKREDFQRFDQGRREYIEPGDKFLISQVCCLVSKFNRRLEVPSSLDEPGVKEMNSSGSKRSRKRKEKFSRTSRLEDSPSSSDRGGFSRYPVKSDVGNAEHAAYKPFEVTLNLGGVHNTIAESTEVGTNQVKAVFPAETVSIEPDSSRIVETKSDLNSNSCLVEIPDKVYDSEGYHEDLSTAVAEPDKFHGTPEHGKLEHSFWDEPMERDCIRYNREFMVFRRWLRMRFGDGQYPGWKVKARDWANIPVEIRLKVHPEMPKIEKEEKPASQAKTVKSKGKPQVEPFLLARVSAQFDFESRLKANEALVRNVVQARRKACAIRLAGLDGVRSAEECAHLLSRLAVESTTSFAGSSNSGFIGLPFPPVSFENVAIANCPVACSYAGVAGGGMSKELHHETFSSSDFVGVLEKNKVKMQPKDVDSCHAGTMTDVSTIARQDAASSFGVGMDGCSTLTHRPELKSIAIGTHNVDVVDAGTCTIKIDDDNTGATKTNGKREPAKQLVSMSTDCDDFPRYLKIMEAFESLNTQLRDQKSGKSALKSTDSTFRKSTINTIHGSATGTATYPSLSFDAGNYFEDIDHHAGLDCDLRSKSCDPETMPKSIVSAATYSSQLRANPVGVGQSRLEQYGFLHSGSSQSRQHLLKSRGKCWSAGAVGGLDNGRSQRKAMPVRGKYNLASTKEIFADDEEEEEEEDDDDSMCDSYSSYLHRKRIVGIRSYEGGAEKANVASETDLSRYADSLCRYYGQLVKYHDRLVGVSETVRSSDGGGRRKQRRRSKELVSGGLELSGGGPSDNCQEMTLYSQLMLEKGKL